MMSPDGINWTTVAMTARDYQSVIFGNDAFLALSISTGNDIASLGTGDIE